MGDQGVWYQAIVNGKPIWHFYSNPAPVTKEQPKIIPKSTQEVSPPTSKNAVIVYGQTAVVPYAPEQTQMLVPATAGYYNYCTYNYNNTYNHVCPATVSAAATAAAAAAAAAAAEAQAKAEAEAEAEAKAKAEGEAKAKAEAIYISEDEVKLDAMLHEQAQALRQLHYLHTVDYGAGDPYGRRYMRM